MDKREHHLVKAIKDTAGSLFWIKVWFSTDLSLFVVCCVGTKSSSCPCSRVLLTLKLLSYLIFFPGSWRW